MDAKWVMNQLRLVQKKHENDWTDSCSLHISNMAKDAANTIEELLKNLTWVSVEERLPKSPAYDWVLVKTKFVEGGNGSGFGVPHVAELRDGVWYCDCYDEPMEELLGLKVVAWFDMQLLQERS